MKNSIGSVFIAIVLLMILMSGCAPVSTPVPPTSTPISTTDTPEFTETVPATATQEPTQTPAPTNTQPPPAPIQITTSLGDIVVMKAKIASQDAFGNQAAPGYRILNVYVESADGSEIDGSAFYKESKDVVVIGDDGSETKSYMGGLLSGQLFVGFTPPATADTFTLVWPGNEPVELVLSR